MEDENWTGPPETYWTRQCYTREPRKCGIYPLSMSRYRRRYIPLPDPCRRPPDCRPPIDCCAPKAPNTKTTHEIDKLNIKVKVAVEEWESFEPREEGGQSPQEPAITKIPKPCPEEPPTGPPLEHQPGPCTSAYIQPYCPPVKHYYPLAQVPCPPPCNAPYYDPRC